MSLPEHLQQTWIQAQTAAANGDFSTLQACAADLYGAWTQQAGPLQQLGQLLHSYGFLSMADACFAQALQLEPNNLSAAVGMANTARDRGEHPKARQLLDQLVARQPDNLALRRVQILGLEYDPQASDAQRFAAAARWGELAKRQAAGHRIVRAPSRPAGAPLRVGYVSADFCQHTVGLLFKDVLIRQQQGPCEIFVYSAGTHKDGITWQIMSHAHWRDIAGQSDRVAAEQVARDQIDVLVDLSGHTAGSRLSLFALRPAPVQVSWLGYFATTGLDCMDAVLLDEWQAPAEVEPYFVERVLRLSCGRLPFQPIHVCPEVQPPPSLRNGHITFGSFNNTSKLTPEVLALWASILRRVPRSRLVLKWRTFNDQAFCQQCLAWFERAGVQPDRVELRGPSSHEQMLGEYADIDIALDPFPFTGGQTSFEALWMGVPVVTWPQARVVSRQTMAILSVLKMPEWVARSAEDYVRIACELAAHPSWLVQTRQTLRAAMRQAPFMDTQRFADELLASFAWLASLRGG